RRSGPQHTPTASKIKFVGIWQMRSEGGKARRATRARGILQALKAVHQIALTPPANRMALTGHLSGHVQIGGAILRGDPEDEPTAKGQRLGSGMGAHKRFQTGVFLRSQRHRTRDRYGHGQGPYRTEDTWQHNVSVPTILHI